MELAKWLVHWTSVLISQAPCSTRSSFMTHCIYVTNVKTSAEVNWLKKNTGHRYSEDNKDIGRSIFKLIREVSYAEFI